MMDEYEKKLTTFRNRRRKENLITTCKYNLWKRPISVISSLMSSDSLETGNFSDEKYHHKIPLLEQDNDCPEQQKSDFVAEPFKFSWFKFLIRFLIWICLFSFSVYIQFGMIFLILSGFYVIWANTRTGPKKPNEISAYSVFNANCEPIEGTYDAKQIESEIRYGLMF